MTYLVQQPARLAWYNPFVSLRAAKDAERAVKFGAGVTLAIQGLGLVVLLIRATILFQHPASRPVMIGAAVTLAVLLGLGVLLAVIGVELFRSQKVWAGVALFALMIVGEVGQLGHWVSLLRITNLMSLSGSILCLRGVLALRRGMPDLDVFR